MKKIVFVLFACLMCLSFATAETTPTVNITEEAQGIPSTVVADIVLANPDATAINITAWHGATINTKPVESNIAPYGWIFYTYGDIHKNYAQHHGVFQTDFLLSVARGSSKTLTTEYSVTLTPSLSGSVTVGDDKDAPLPSAATIGLNLSLSVSAKISTSVTFNGPPEDSEANSRSFYVAYYGDIGGWSCTATRDHPASTVQMAGQFIEPTEYVEYSVDRTIK